LDGNIFREKGGDDQCSTLQQKEREGLAPRVVAKAQEWFEKAAGPMVPSSSAIAISMVGRGAGLGQGQRLPTRRGRSAVLSIAEPWRTQVRSACEQRLHCFGVF
jgi:hypothetical protein